MSDFPTLGLKFDLTEIVGGKQRLEQVKRIYQELGREAEQARQKAQAHGEAQKRAGDAGAAAADKVKAKTVSATAARKAEKAALDQNVRQLELLNRIARAMHLEEQARTRFAKANALAESRALREVEEATRRLARAERERTQAAQHSRGGVLSSIAATLGLRGAYETAGGAGQRFGAGLTGLGKTLRSTRLAVADLRFAVLAMMGALTLGGLSQAADQMVALEARTRLYAKAQSDVPFLLEKTYETAQRARMSLDGVATLYTRLAPLGAQLGKSQTELLAVVETVGKAFAIGGASAAEATSSAQQFAQALSSNRFGGDELRSVAENAPVLLAAIAEGVNQINPALNLNAATFIKWAQAGNANSDIMVRALEKAQGRIDSMFKTMPVTIGQAMTLVGNAVKRAIDQIDRGFGAATGGTRLSQQVAEMIAAFSRFLESKAFIDGVTDALVGLSEALRIAGEAAKLIGDVLPGLAAGFGALLVVRAATAALTAWRAAAAATAVQNALLAQTAFQTGVPFQAMSGRATALASGLNVVKRAGAGLLAFLGGPWVAGFTAAAVAVSWVYNALKKGEAAAKGLTGAKTDLAQALDGAILRAKAFGNDTEQLTGIMAGLTAAEKLNADERSEAQKLAQARADVEKQLAIASLESAKATLQQSKEEARRAAGLQRMFATLTAGMAKIASIPVAGQSLLGFLIGGPALGGLLKDSPLTDAGSLSRMSDNFTAAADRLDAAVAGYDASIRSAEDSIAILNGMDFTATTPEGGDGVSKFGTGDKAGKIDSLTRQIRDAQAELAALTAESEAAARAAAVLNGFWTGGERTAAGYAAALAEQAKIQTDARVAGEKAAIAAEQGAKTIAGIANPAIRAKAQALFEARAALIRYADAEEQMRRAEEAGIDRARQIADTEAYAAALRGGADAMAEYVRNKRIMDELDRTGVSADPYTARLNQRRIERDVDRQAAADLEVYNAKRLKALNEELALARMSSDQRAVMAEVERIANELAEAGLKVDRERLKVDLQREAIDRRRADMAARLKDDLRDGFVRGGEIDFSHIGDALEAELRTSVYDALMAEPIETVVDAVVNVTTQGLETILNQIKAAMGGAPGDSNWTTLTKFFGEGGKFSQFMDKFGSGGSKVAGMAGSLAKAAPDMIAGYAVGNVAADAAGVGQPRTTAGQLWVAGASAAGTMIGGPVLGAIAGAVSRIVVTALEGKESNHGTDAVFDAQGNFTIRTNRKSNDQTKGAVTDAAEAISSVIDSLDKLGINARGVIKEIGLGQRDASNIFLNNGQVRHSAVGDPKALVEEATKALLQFGQYDDPQMKALVNQMVAANKSFEEIVEKLDRFIVAQKVPDDLRLAIKQYTDPEAFALESLRRSQVERRDQIRGYAEEGLYTREQLAEIDGLLSALEREELAAALERLAEGADGAAASLAQIEKVQADIVAYVESLKTGQLSPLSPTAQLALSQEAFMQALTKANAGDLSAMQGITGNATDYLSAAQRYYGSGTEYAAVFQTVTQALEALGTREFEDPLAAKLEEEIAKLIEAIDGGFAELIETLNPGAGGGAPTPPPAPTVPSDGGWSPGSHGSILDLWRAAMRDGFDSVNQQLAAHGQAVVASQQQAAGQVSRATHERANTEAALRGGMARMSAA